MKPTDVIVSASPEFLIKEMADRLGVQYVASQIDFRTGKYKNPPCAGKQKVVQFRRLFPDVKIKDAYGNSKSDLYILKEAENGYMVKNKSVHSAHINRI